MAAFDTAVPPFSAFRLIMGNGFGKAIGLVSGLGFGSDFASAIAVGVKAAGTLVAGIGGRDPFSSATDSAWEPLCAGAAPAGWETRPEIGVGAGMAAGGDPVAGEAASSAAFDCSESDNTPEGSAGPAAGEGGAFKASASCGSLLRSVFVEPAGLDLAILEDIWVMLPRANVTVDIALPKQKY